MIGGPLPRNPQLYPTKYQDGAFKVPEMGTWNARPVSFPFWTPNVMARRWGLSCGDYLQSMPSIAPATAEKVRSSPRGPTSLRSRVTSASKDSRT